MLDLFAFYPSPPFKHPNWSISATSPERDVRGRPQRQQQ